MKLKTLKLENFRLFSSLELEFSKQVTVLVGVNGSGKTSILDALAILLSRLIGRVRSTKGTGRFFTDSDIFLNLSETTNSLEIEFNDNPISWTVSKTKRGRKKQRITNLSKIKDVVDMVYGSLNQDEEASVPLAVFYGVNRSVLDIPLRIRTSHKFDQLSAYDQALAGARNDFRLFFEWYRKQEDYENEQRLYPVEHVDKSKKGRMGDLEYRDPQLQAVRTAINQLTGFTNLRIRRNPLRMEVRKGKEHFDVRQLSDGEKCLLALAGDLARRLAIANPSLENPLKGQAVILIDEVDLHLHPEWQHRVIPKLKSTYSNCQFVLTTHSPQVLSHVSCKDIWCLVHGKKGMKTVRPDGTFGQDSNFLLKTLMGTSYRPSNIEKDINRLFGLIRKDVKRARKLLERLKSKVEGESPELVRAETLLHRREVLGN